MYGFTYWHAYFDSAFLSHPLKISDALCQDLEITAAHLSRWPQLEKLPQLPKLFELLELFILDEGNWTGSMCSEGELDAIQMQLNRILLHLQCEKRYGAQFWHKSNRRIQASIVHFSIFMRRFVLGIIPEDCRNVLQAHRLDKMVTEMSKLESLVNLIMKLIKPIQYFLFREDFEEEARLSKQFLEDFCDFIHTLPRVKRSALVKIPKLMEYICIMNPIQTEQYEDMPHVRKKNATTFEKPKIEKKYSLEKNYNENKKSFKVVNNSIIKIKDKKNSLEKISFDSPKKRNDFIKNFQIFKFKENIRKYSFNNKAKNKTVTSLQTKEKTASIEKDRSPSHDRSLTIINNSGKMKTRTIANDVRMKEASITIDRRSRQMTTKSIFSRRSKSIRKPQDLQGEEVQYQRQQKTKKKKVLKIPMKTSRYSQQSDLTDGKQKGWAIVREYLRKKIAERKLKKLILQ